MAQQAEVLSPKLYNALVSVFGPCRIANEGVRGVFSLVPGKKECWSVGKIKKKWAFVKSWGETYTFNCPHCGDDKYRLSFSYLWGSEAMIEDKKASKVTFSQRLMVCHRRGCQSQEGFQQYVDKLRAVLAGTIGSLELVTPMKPEEFDRYALDKEGILPSCCVPIISDNIPRGIFKYLEERGFDFNELHEKYFVKYVPMGGEYDDEGKTKKFFEDRILIPIVQATRLVSWQARKITPGKDYKYIFPGGCRKSNCLYNMDRALFTRDVVLVEGATDVWRIGDRAMALFGKTLSRSQLTLLKCLFDYEASCVVVPDGDDEDALEKWTDIAETLRLGKIFKYGVGICKLAKGKDPADYSREELLDLIADTPKSR